MRAIKTRQTTENSLPAILKALCLLSQPDLSNSRDTTDLGKIRRRKPAIRNSTASRIQPLSHPISRRGYSSMDHLLLCHFFTQFGSVRASRAFFRFSCMTHWISLFVVTSHFSMKGLPASGRAATATLQQ